MNGSEKQVAWANKIRPDMEIRLNEALANVREWATMTDLSTVNPFGVSHRLPKQVRRTMTGFEMLNATIALIDQNPDILEEASFWIDCRDEDGPNLLSQLVRRAAWRLEEEREREAFLDVDLRINLSGLARCSVQSQLTREARAAQGDRT